jgi:hypothetical protein
MKLSWRDKFQMVTTGLFVALGLAMLVRTAALHLGSFERYGVGILFAGFGAYRACQIVRAVRGRRTCT